jgi:hypothetical protein
VHLNCDNSVAFIFEFSSPFHFDIEEMLRDFKSGGYNLEDTHVSGQRLISLILLISQAIQAQQYPVKKLNVWVFKNMSAELKNLGGLFDDIVVFILVFMATIGLISWKILMS